ncbi:MAG: DUF2723 domain-containing protein [Caldilineaceae bacterium]|nr:DUF2723 domain-containing protein [Caldilineaceae bacterium]
MVKLSAPDPLQPPPHAPKQNAAAHPLPERIRLDRTDRQIATILGAVSFALYLRTLAPGLLPGDSGEFQFAAWQLGLAHPTGYPFYLLLGWLWQHTLALVGASPAWALNALSALTAGLGVALLYLVMAQWTPLPTPRRRMAGLYSSILLAANLTYWSQALIAEVYALHTVFMLALLLAAQALVRAPSTRQLLIVAALSGLALTHHALTLLWLPALLLYWLLADSGWRRLPLGSWGAALVAALLPLLLYAYIPLRAGPEASPWYHQRLGDGVLTLYSNDWASFWAFISGKSIDAGFRSAADAWAQIPQAAWLWHYHFGWVGLAMIAAGLVWLGMTRRYAILIPSLLYVIVQQIFNLYYNIGDILVYYIPLYLVGAIWAGFGLAGLVTGDWRARQSTAAAPPVSRSAGLGPVGWVVGIALLLLAVRDAPLTSAQIDQSNSNGARQQWEGILAASPPAYDGHSGRTDNAILVSNDRNEIVPLFYLQEVEDRAMGMTGLFPGIAPDARFSDIGATLETALTQGGDQPVYLIKPMPGLEVRFDLAPAASPLVRVLGPAATPPTVVVDQPYGPLQLLGYDLIVNGESAELALHWQVNEPLNEPFGENYVATAQLLDANDNKIAQDDHAPGGDYYPTSLWKAGEQVVVRHHLPLTEPLPETIRLLVNFYRPTDLAPLAQPLILPLVIR